MRKYVLKRLIMTLPILVGVTFFCFILINLIPSDPAEVVLRVRQTPLITEEAIAEMREELGLNQPFLTRYVNWVSASLRLDFGVSFVNPSRIVAEELGRALPATLVLAGTSLVIVLVISTPVGILCAIYKDTFFDRVVRGLVFLTTALPSYLVAMLLIYFFSIYLGWLPTGGRESIRHLILPAVTIALMYISTYIRLIRNGMIDQMKQDYVLYADARGLPKKLILLRHVLKNALQSSLTALGMSIPQLIAGTIVVENIFSWPGLGRLCVTAIFNRDYPIIQAYVLLIGVLFVLFNLIFDVIQYVMDPRSREEG